MRLVEILESRMRVRDVATLLGVTPQHIYKMAEGALPALRIAGAVRAPVPLTRPCLPPRQRSRPRTIEEGPRLGLSSYSRQNGQKPGTNVRRTSNAGMPESV